jgi:hypothetical protein
LLLDRKEKLSESAMTGLLIQVKQRKKKGTTQKYAIYQEKFQFFPPPTKMTIDPTAKTTDTRPYVTLVAEVGVQSPISVAASTPVIIRKKMFKSAPNPPAIVGTSTVSTTDPQSLYIPVQPAIRHLRDVHPRYSIFAYGCSDKVYSVIAESDRAGYKALLGNRDMLDEHPRKDDASLLAVRTMKQFWSAGNGCYKWIEDDFIHMYEEWEDNDGGLAVGKYEDSET